MNAPKCDYCGARAEVRELDSDCKTSGYSCLNCSLKRTIDRLFEAEERLGIDPCYL